MRVVADVRDVDHLAIGENRGRVPRFFGISRIVFRAAEDQGLGLDVLPVVDHRVHAAHLARQSAHIGHVRPVIAQPLSITDAHMLGELRLPFDIILFRPANQAGIHFVHVGIGIDFTGKRLKAAAFAAIGEADLVDGYQMRGAFRVKEGESGHHLPADGMPDHRRLLDTEMIHQTRGVGSPQVDAVGNDRFGRLAPAEAILDDHPVAFGAQCGDLFLPIPAVIEPAVMEDHRAAVGGAAGRHVHIGEPNILVVHPKVHVADWIGILDFLKVHGNGSPIRGSRLGRHRLRGYRAGRADGEKDDQYFQGM